MMTNTTPRISTYQKVPDPMSAEDSCTKLLPGRFMYAISAECRSGGVRNFRGTVQYTTAGGALTTG